MQVWFRESLGTRLIEWASHAKASGKFRLGYQSQRVPSRCCTTERQFDPCLKETTRMRVFVLIVTRLSPHSTTLVREVLSDAPYFGLSLWTHFKLALCACASGWSSTVEPKKQTWIWLYLEYPTLNSVFEAACQMPERVEVFTRQVLLQFA